MGGEHLYILQVSVQIPLWQEAVCLSKLVLHSITLPLSLYIGTMTFPFSSPSCGHLDHYHMPGTVLDTSNVITSLNP